MVHFFVQLDFFLAFFPLLGTLAVHQLLIVVGTNRGRIINMFSYKEAFARAFDRTIRETGIEAFRKTSMFGCAKKKKNTSSNVYYLRTKVTWEKISDFRHKAA